MRKRIVRALLIVPMVLALSAQTALGAYVQGTANCGWKIVYLYSSATIDVYHIWDSDTEYYEHYVPTYVEDATESHTFWRVQWNVSKNAAGYFCQV